MWVRVFGCWLASSRKTVSHGICRLYRTRLAGSSTFYRCTSLWAPWLRWGMARRVLIPLLSKYFACSWWYLALFRSLLYRGRWVQSYLMLTIPQHSCKRNSSFWTNYKSNTTSKAPCTMRSEKPWIMIIRRWWWDWMLLLRVCRRIWTRRWRCRFIGLLFRVIRCLGGWRISGCWRLLGVGCIRDSTPEKTTSTAPVKK